MRLTVPGASFFLVTDASWVKLRMACQVLMPCPILILRSPLPSPVPASTAVPASTTLPATTNTSGSAVLPGPTSRLHRRHLKTCRQGCCPARRRANDCLDLGGRSMWECQQFSDVAIEGCLEIGRWHAAIDQSHPTGFASAERPPG